MSVSVKNIIQLNKSCKLSELTVGINFLFLDNKKRKLCEMWFEVSKIKWIILCNITTKLVILIINVKCNIDVFNHPLIKDYLNARKMDYKWINCPSRRGKTPWITFNLLLLSLILANSIWQTQGEWIRDRGQWINLLLMRCVWKWNRFGTSLLAFDIEKQTIFSRRRNS